VVLTNGDVDHVAGLLTLRERHAFTLFALAPVHALLAQNPIFGVLDPARVRRVEVAPGARFAAAGLELELFPVPGKAPLYAEEAEPEIGGETGETAGVFVHGAGLAYVPGCAALTPPLLDRLHGAPVVLFDGTLYADDEMIRAGLGEKTGRRMGHIPIAGPGGSFAALAPLPGRKIYVHLNNTNPLLIEGSPERLRVEAAGFEVAHDGMEIAL
jgi:pyrroloquinoline quinone biosynthesis protein B